MKILDAARQSRALQSIGDDLRAEQAPADDPQWHALRSLNDRVGLQFTSALKEIFDQLVFPSINSALRGTSIDLAFAGNTNGEATIKQALLTARKFTIEIAEESLRIMPKPSCSGGVVLWSDLKRGAAVKTDWPLQVPSALEDHRADAIRKDQWRLEGNHVPKVPFPPPPCAC